MSFIIPPEPEMVKCKHCKLAYNVITQTSDCPHHELGIKIYHAVGETKFDEGKPRIDLIPPELLFGLGELYRKGAKKHGDRNWEQGLTASQTFAACMRHLWKWWMRRDRDQQSAVSHLLAGLWNVVGLYVCEVRQTLKDDRPPKAENLEKEFEQLLKD